MSRINKIVEEKGQKRASALMSSIFPSILIYTNKSKYINAIIVLADQLSQADREAIEDHHQSQQGLNLKGKKCPKYSVTAIGNLGFFYLGRIASKA